MSTITYSMTLTKLNCGTCSIPFAMPSNLHAAALADGRWFWCPNGHRIHYFETENARLAKEADRARRQLAAARSQATHLSDQLGAERRSKAAVKGHLTRIKRRIANGVCPCCQRSFANVTRHMSSQHPEFVEDLRAKEAEVARG